MKKSILAALSHLVVRNADGSINVEATGENVANAMVMELQECASADATIEAAFHNLFDRLPAGTAVKTDIATQAVCAALAGGDFAAIIEWTTKVEDYLSRSTVFQGVRGRSGGLKRVG